MTPPAVDNYSPVYEQTQASSALDNQSQDLQQNAIVPLHAQQSSQQVTHQDGQPSTAHNQMNDIPGLVDSIDVQIQPSIIDPMEQFRRSGNDHASIRILMRNRLRTQQTTKLTEILSQYRCR